MILDHMEEVWKEVDTFVSAIQPLSKGEPWDGDETELISKMVLKALNKRNGNSEE